MTIQEMADEAFGFNREKEKSAYIQGCKEITNQIENIVIKATSGESHSIAFTLLPTVIVDYIKHLKGELNVN